MKKPLPHHLQDVADQLKPLSTAEDLVALGIAGHSKTLANRRSLGLRPGFVKIRGCGIRYPKGEILRWLAEDGHFVEGIR